MPKTATRQPATKQMFQLLADEDGEHREGLYYCGYCVEMDMARSNVADNDYTDIYGAEYQIVRRSLSTRCGGEDCES